MNEERVVVAPRRPMTKNLIRLRQLLDHHDGNQTKTAEAIGYSPTALADFLRNGEMPLTADLACEALIRRLGATLRPSEFVSVRARSEHRETIAKLVGSFRGVEVDGFVNASLAADDFLLIVQLPADKVETFIRVAAAIDGTAKKAGGLA